MKCQDCNETATHHVTDLIAGQPAEYHVCEAHLRELDKLTPILRREDKRKGIGAFWTDQQLRHALAMPLAREKLAAHLLPALCLALVDEQAEVRIIAAFRLMVLSSSAESTKGALQDALQDPDARVRRAAAMALDSIIAKDDLPWFF